MEQDIPVLLMGQFTGGSVIGRVRQDRDAYLWRKGREGCRHTLVAQIVDDNRQFGRKGQAWGRKACNEGEVINPFL